MKRFIIKVKIFFKNLFGKKHHKHEEKETGLDPVFPNDEQKLKTANVPIEKIVEILDKVHESDDDLYTTIGVLVCEIDDVYKADNKEAREKQKVDCFNTLDYIKKQLMDL